MRREGHCELRAEGVCGIHVPRVGVRWRNRLQRLYSQCSGLDERRGGFLHAASVAISSEAVQSPTSTIPQASNAAGGTFRIPFLEDRYTWPERLALVWVQLSVGSQTPPPRYQVAGYELSQTLNTKHYSRASAWPDALFVRQHLRPTYLRDDNQQFHTAPPAIHILRSASRSCKHRRHGAAAFGPA
jgi:hypothetical protein